jgi:threonine dehydratase
MRAHEFGISEGVRYNSNLMEQRPPSLGEIWSAHIRIRPYLAPTPLRRSAALSEQTGSDLYLKLENWQPTGSFKVRGAFNLLAQLSPEQQARGLVTASAGNHGAAVGYAALQLGKANVDIFVPGTTPRAKLDKMRRLGVRVHAVGMSYDDAHHAAAEHERATGATFVHAYDDVRTVAGAGTIAVEILEAVADLDVVLVPVGGGGLISGIAVALKAVAPQVRVIAVQPEASPALRDSLRDARCYEEYTAAPTICDGLAGGIGQIVFQVARSGGIDEVLIVSEKGVRQAVAALAREEQMIVEGSGAVGLAAVYEFPERWRGKRVALILSGANMDVGVLQEILAAG